jgi:DNA sulfur modification protein DndD
MLLKSLSLHNFRQFVDEVLTFSFADNKNVTIIMGQNGSGKTTLAQAFTWCLYGDTQFEDQIVLSKSVAIKLLPKNEVDVKVSIELEHNGTDYTIIRTQKYFLDQNGNIKWNPTFFVINYKKDGQKEFVDELKRENVMNGILPIELSKYFFFDGERIVKMSKDIQKGTSKEFSEAVTSLLGLKAFKEALKHLKDSNSSLIKTYSRSYDAGSNSVLSNLIDEIDNYEKDIEKCKLRLDSITNEELFGEKKRSELESKILLFKESEELMKQRDAIRRKVRSYQEAKNSGAEKIFRHFNQAAQAYFAKQMVFEVLKKLSDTDNIDKGIPEINDKTVDYLIKRGKCICGHKIEFNSDEYRELNKLFDFIPPQAIGNQISQFIQISKVKYEAAESVFETISEDFKLLREYDDQFESLNIDLQNVESKLSKMDNIGKLQQELINCESNLKHLENERDELNQHIGEILNNLNNVNARREEYALKDEKNRKIELYRAYAEHLYSRLNSEYSQKESETRNTLETKINTIFKHIYNGGLSLTLDENYFVDVKVSDMEGYTSGVETSTAQSISVIFAFIAGVIEMAKESKSDENKILVSEPYPLVMDAPLSAFDTTRIKTVCDILPTVAQQVIIFIKDTDGILAEEHMGKYLGQRYEFDKINEFETHIVER